jgi:ATP-dependent RNA helicase RhlE
LADEQYVIPTPIQAQTIPAALAGRDILGCAQTGTGKTAAFALPILNRLGDRHRKAAPNRPLVLVLAPTRELAIQIEESFATYGRHLRVRQVLVYGGVGQGNQVRALNRGAHILVATPGRLLDLMDQGFIKLSDLEVFVLDEADRMLDMGFLPALKRIISQLPDQRQSLFFSATLPPNITQLSASLLTEPVSVNVTPKSTSVSRIEQRVLFVERHGKQALLQQILAEPQAERAIVFTRTKRGANVLAQTLGRNGFHAAVIHGNKSQSARQRALEAFRRKEVQVLVATDVAARGIDIDGITHVINYDLPTEPENYVHRIGRTGRAGAEGIALTFCSATERDELQAIEDLIGIRVPLDPHHQHSTQPRVSSASSNQRQPRRRNVSNAKRSAAPRPASRYSSEMVSEEGQSSRRRPPRQGQPRRQTFKQPS